jgi:hypothetical protein
MAGLSTILRMRKNLLFFMGMLCTIAVKAQSVTDTMLKHSPVRTLSDQQYTAYLKGVDINRMAYIAEINHYPLPDKLLQYKKDLDLSPVQITQITVVLKILQMKKMEIGQSVIRNERMLDSIFRTRKVDEGSVIFYGNRYGLYEGEYRTALLTACYKTQQLLSERQVKLFEALQKHN